MSPPSTAVNMIASKLREIRTSAERRTYPLIVVHVLGRTWVVQETEPGLAEQLAHLDEHRERIMDLLLKEHGIVDEVGPVELEARLAAGVVTREDQWHESTRLMLLATPTKRRTNGKG